MTQAVIMAGGKGTRLRALTNDAIPKPMVPVAGKPLLQWQVECLRNEGMTDVIMVIGHLGERIREFFQDGVRFGVSIRYIQETTPLGTAGSLSLLTPLLSSREFFLVFGDLLFDIDLARMLRFHKSKNAAATLFVHPNAHPFDSDLVICGPNERVMAINHKNSRRTGWYHNRVNAGFYLLDRAVCQRVPLQSKTDLEKDLLTGMIEDGEPVYAYRSSEYIKDVGTLERIAGAEQELKSGYISRRSLRRRQKAVFLDRDGTVNRKNGLIYREDQLELEDGAAEAIRRINESGHLAILATNQPVVARGLCTIEGVERIHQKLETLLGQKNAYFDEICFCPHHPDKGFPEENPDYKIPCRCRKPKIGMLEDCAKRYNLDLSESWVVGDTTVDIQTGKNAGTHTALVLTGDAGRDQKYDAQPDLICRNLGEAVDKILEREGQG